MVRLLRQNCPVESFGLIEFALPLHLRRALEGVRRGRLAISWWRLLSHCKIRGCLRVWIQRVQMPEEQQSARRLSSGFRILDLTNQAQASHLRRQAFGLR